MINKILKWFFTRKDINHYRNELFDLHHEAILNEMNPRGFGYGKGYITEEDADILSKLAGPIGGGPTGPKMADVRTVDPLRLPEKIETDK